MCDLAFARLLSGPLLAAALLAAGCGARGKTEIERFSVTGTVTVGNAPVTNGIVTFHPDETKGNTSSVVGMGMVRSDGGYDLMSNGEPGVPAGWYKVTIANAGVPPGLKDKASVKGSRYHAKYKDLSKTDLTIEVLANPSDGQYDLHLSK